MAEELQEREQEFEAVVNEVLTLNKEAKQLKGRAKEQKIEVIRNRINRLKQIVRAFKTEISYSKQAGNATYKERIRGFEAKSEELSLELQLIEKDETTPPFNTNQLLARAEDIQRQDIAMLQEAIRKTEQDKQIASTFKRL